VLEFPSACDEGSVPPPSYVGPQAVVMAAELGAPHLPPAVSQESPPPHEAHVVEAAQLRFNTFWGSNAIGEILIDSSATFKQARGKFSEQLRQSEIWNPSAAAARDMDVFAGLGPSSSSSLSLTADQCGWNRSGVDPDCYANYMPSRAIERITLTFKWKDHGWGGEEGRCYLKLKGPGGHKLKVNVGGPAPHSFASVTCTLRSRQTDPIIDLFEPGDVIAVWFKVGSAGSPGSTASGRLYVEDFRMEVHYQAPPAVSTEAGKAAVTKLIYAKDPTPSEQEQVVEPESEPGSGAAMVDAWDLAVGLVRTEREWRACVACAQRAAQAQGGFKLELLTDEETVAMDIIARSPVFTARLRRARTGVLAPLQRLGESLTTSSMRTIQVMQSSRVSLSTQRQFQDLASPEWWSTAQTAARRAKRVLVGVLACLLVCAVLAGLVCWVYFPVQEIKSRNQIRDTWEHTNCTLLRQTCAVSSKCLDSECECLERAWHESDLRLTPTCSWVDVQTYQQVQGRLPEGWQTRQSSSPDAHPRPSEHHPAQAQREMARAMSRGEEVRSVQEGRGAGKDEVEKEWEIRASTPEKANCERHYKVEFTFQGPRSPGPGVETKEVSCSPQYELDRTFGGNSEGESSLCAFVVGRNCAEQPQRPACAVQALAAVGAEIECWVNPADDSDVTVEGSRGVTQHVAALVALAAVSSVGCFACSFLACLHWRNRH